MSLHPLPEGRGFTKITDKKKEKVNQILMQGRSFRNFIWFNVKSEDIQKLMKYYFKWNRNITSLYVNKETLNLELKDVLPPKMESIIKKVFINNNHSQHEYLL